MPPACGKYVEETLPRACLHLATLWKRGRSEGRRAVEHTKYPAAILKGVFDPQSCIKRELAWQLLSGRKRNIANLRKAGSGSATNQLGQKREDKIVSIRLRIDAQEMRDAHFARDLFCDLALQRGERRLALLDAPARCGPAARPVSAAHKKHATHRVED